MARRTRRQRLKRDPANQPRDKIVAWARREGVIQVAFSGLLSIPRFTAADAGHPKIAPVLARQERRWARIEEEWARAEAEIEVAAASAPRIGRCGKVAAALANALRPAMRLFHR